MTAFFSKFDRPQDDQTTNASDNEKPAAAAEFSASGKAVAAAEKAAAVAEQPAATVRQSASSAEQPAVAAPAPAPARGHTFGTPDTKWGSPPEGVAHGDWIVLVSSDMHVFRVPKWYLQTASPIFRQMIEDRRSPENPYRLQYDSNIQFEDDVFERAVVIRHFLDMLDGSWSPSPRIDHALRIQMTNFTYSWSCDAAFRLLINSITVYYQSGVVESDMIQPLFLALQYDEMEIAGAAFDYCLTSCGPQPTAAGDNMCPSRGQSGFPVLHPTGWSLDMIKKVSPRYTWALLRVFQPYGPGKFPQKSDAERLRKMFLEMIEIGNKYEEHSVGENTL